MPELLDAALVRILNKDKQILEQTELPIITVSATTHEDLKKFYGLPDDDTTPDLVFSRAHFSMAVGVAIAAWVGKKTPSELTDAKIDQKKAWLVDPTNYVSHNDWFSVKLTEKIGKTLARHSLLKLIKDLVDKFGRQKLPIIDSITPPLLYLTSGIKRPILSFHIAAGNVLAGQGKSVLQVITDPHVRYDYLEFAHLKNLTYAVFDEATKLELLEKAAYIDKTIDPNRVVVTGPPVDPRILMMRDKKQPWRSGKLRLCITTGGLGTNKEEIGDILKQLLPQLRKKDPKIQLVVYASTQQDIAEMVRELAKKARVAVGEPDEKYASLRLLYHPQIVDANELLIKFAFPWAHGFITKPSGDMAYDAVAAGCFLLTLAEWGEWEHRIREIFEQKGISRSTEPETIVAQLEVLMSAQDKAQSWIEQAMNKAFAIDTLFLRGSENIIKAYKAITS